MSCYVDLEAEHSDSDTDELQSFIQLSSPVLHGVRSPLSRGGGDGEGGFESGWQGEFPAAFPSEEVEPRESIVEARAVTPECEDSGEPAESFQDAREIKEGAGFRVNRAWVLLTYSHLPAEPELSAWQTFFSSKGATSGVICKEKHRSGIWHLHAYIEKFPKWDIKDCKFFDFHVHPSFSRSKENGFSQRADEYVRKRGVFLSWNIWRIPNSSAGYERRKRDAELWAADIAAAARPPPPSRFLLPDGREFVWNEPRRKNSNLVISGAASMAKTSWVYKYFGQFAVYWVPDGVHSWDQWNDSSVIIWDDLPWPSKSIITMFTNRGLPCAPPAYLNARYFNRMVSPGPKCMIILCNEFPGNCPYSQDDWFTTRFEIINVTEAWEDQDSDLE